MAFALSTLHLTSPAFEDGGVIPAKHTDEGDDLSPALVWQDIPDGTKGFALICHDPDAPLVQNGTYGFVHWVLYNIPASTPAWRRRPASVPVARTIWASWAMVAPCLPKGMVCTATTSGCWRWTSLPTTCPRSSRCVTCCSRSSRICSA